jgi:hypothetical protein
MMELARQTERERERERGERAKRFWTEAVYQFEGSNVTSEALRLLYVEILFFKDVILYLRLRWLNYELKHKDVQLFG